MPPVSVEYRAETLFQEQRFSRQPVDVQGRQVQDLVVCDMFRVG